MFTSKLEKPDKSMQPFNITMLWQICLVIMPLRAVDMFLRREMKKQNKKQKKKRKDLNRTVAPLNHGLGELLHCFNAATFMSPH